MRRRAPRVAKKILKFSTGPGVAPTHSNTKTKGYLYYKNNVL